MAFITGLYLLVDVAQHKGQARVLFPGNFNGKAYGALHPAGNNVLMNRDKKWMKAVNSTERMNLLTEYNPGFECDVYFDTTTKTFEVHHDPGKSMGYRLDDLLKQYQQKKMQAGIWLDIKNLDEGNAASCLSSLIKIRNAANLQNRILVESDQPGLLNAFCDSGFFTVYYVPFFNPYQMNGNRQQLWADSIASQISRSKVNALSGYYFQSGFLKHYFPRYPVLTWVDNPSFSLVNYLFQRKINADTSIYIILKP
jgi:hypothetical protein